MNFHLKPNQNQQGFTLLEILVVLVVLSLVSVAVISTLPFGTTHSETDDVQTAYQRIQLLQENAMLSGRTYGVQLNDTRTSVKFLTYTKGQWHPVPQAMMNSEFTISDDVTMTFQQGGSIWLNKDRLYFPEKKQGITDSEFGDKEKIVTPQIVIYSTGMITPFKLSFSGNSGSTSSISVTANGQLVMGDRL